MAIAIPNEGKSYFLNKMLDSTLYIKLFTNDVTGSQSVLNLLELSDLTEASGGGYVKKAILSTEWTVSEIEDYGYAEAVVKRWDFTDVLTGNAKIYGYYIVDTTESTLLVVNRFALDFYPYGNGAYYETIPTIAFSSIYS